MVMGNQPDGYRRRSKADCRKKLLILSENDGTEPKG